jgi:hypothetical protein
LLASTTLGDLLGRLYRGGVNGVLELVEREGRSAGRSHRIHFERGLIDEVETSLAVPRVGDVLVHRGAISQGALARVEGVGSRRIGETLLEQRMVSPGALREALHSQLGLRLDALFELKDAFVRFHVRRSRRPDPIRPEPLSAREFLNGRPRKRGAVGPVARRRSAAERAALDVLGLPLSADSREVCRAFRKKASEVHPDRHPGASHERRSELLQRFAELSRAYHLLVTDP